MPTIVNVEENVHVPDSKSHEDQSNILDLQPYAVYDFPSIVDRPQVSAETLSMQADRHFNPRHLQSFSSTPSIHSTFIANLSHATSARPTPVGRPSTEVADAERLRPPASMVLTPTYSLLRDRTPHRADSPFAYPSRSNSIRNPTISDSSLNEKTANLFLPPSKGSLHSSYSAVPHPNRAPRVQSSTNPVHTSRMDDVQNVHLQQAIVEHGFCNIDDLPRLVVRQTKTYANQSIHSMGQLFPTWFQNPDYRCILCFTCDHVFTPQRFMLHLHDDGMRSEQLLGMSPIELLSSEQMSEAKVRL